MLTVEEAFERIMAQVHVSPIERIPTERATGRILREPISTDRDLPPFDRSTMDGIAIAHAAFAAGCRTFNLVGTQAAGQPAATLAHPADSAIEIMTGAMRPIGTDTVIPYEQVEISDQQARISDGTVVERGQFLNAQGADRKAGDVLLPAGTLLRSPQIAIAISTGATHLAVAKPPSFAIVSVGDELIEPDRPVAQFQIRPSNAWGLRAALHGLGCPASELVTLPDNPAAIEETLSDLLARHDGLMLSGGVSRGKFDFIPAALEKLGVALDFHRVSQKPGKPMWFGISPRHTPVFALPGNPVSTMICFHRFVKPYIRRTLGATDVQPETIALQSAIEPNRSLTLFLPIRRTPAGSALQEYHGSGDYAALGESDGFLEIPPGVDIVPAGAAIRYHAWDV
ncbi:MAG: molybdopterin molybdotransferase MoeA [Kiritimatiellae bacterium]|nr:molybdopterin molybdotransferase MoeA [Kiritimatiellia bacterium]MCO5062190.1 molybdopterin molybdotransferase MoeA [Kiritimatiellia bacterium]MCO5068996.1 molybdopterin molybdotransferase MoeA [Kiritimatiellia bacterium]MCO6401671.1 molybdopterin molybdotransferase MoeA [Verrucomicrobiota bacterium]